MADEASVESVTRKLSVASVNNVENQPHGDQKLSQPSYSKDVANAAVAEVDNAGKPAPQAITGLTTTTERAGDYERQLSFNDLGTRSPKNPEPDAGGHVGLPSSVSAPTLQSLKGGNASSAGEKTQAQTFENVQGQAIPSRRHMPSQPAFRNSISSPACHDLAAASSCSSPGSWSSRDSHTGEELLDRRHGCHCTP